ncbi:MAG: hypothetical protein NTX44_11585 [Ignavibacteriales bacterium]|nr:hypothetical protein [Ignavibacteriales bacterium]
MEKVKIVLYLVFVLLLCYLTFSLATDYQQKETRIHCSFIIWVIDTIDLFIHETGHLVFKVFGTFMGFLGGSLFQILIPFAAVVVFARSSWRSLPLTFYWTGQSIVNVSIYIGDAPYQRLQLISRGAIHDWRWLFNYTGLMEYAEAIAAGVNVLGLITCVAGIGVGFYYVVHTAIQLSSQKKLPPHKEN